MDKGIVYIGTDEDFITKAKFAAQITKKVMDLPITLIADRPVETDIFDSVIIDNSPTQSFSDKPRNLLDSPYDRTLYLDSDVYLLEDISEIFDLLDEFDVVAAVDPNEWELRYEKTVDYGDIPDSFPVYQTGVLAFRSSDNGNSLLNRWKDIHMSEGIDRDQASFRIAMYHSDAKITALSSNYNCLIGWPMQVVGEVKVVHDTLEVIESEHDLAAVADAINDSENPRLLYNYGDEIHFPLNRTLDCITGSVRKLVGKL